MFPDPGLTIPRLRFGTGQVLANQPVLSPSLPDIPGPVSQWRVIMWNRDQFLQPDRMTTDDPSTSDTLLGRAAYAFTTPDRTAHLRVYRNRARETWVYELFEQGGNLNSGGANLFLSATTVVSDLSMDQQIVYSFLGKLSAASVTYDTAEAERNGAVGATAFSGFVLQLREPETNQTATIFLQIPITTSRGGSTYYRGGCRLDGDMASFTANQNVPGDEMLPFRPDPDPPHEFRYVLNRYLCALMVNPFSCSGHGERQQFSMPTASRDFRNWRLKSMYVGLETRSHDLRPGSRTPGFRGTVALGLQVSDLKVVRLPTTMSHQSVCGDGG